ncbi:MAG: arylesterase [Rickettsiales bacterium]|nr:arylesterase [Rickettsiales bacterium]
MKIVVLGDSLSSGYGLPVGESFPDKLAQALTREGHTILMVNEGITGHTSADGLARIQTILTHQADIVLLALGGNDMLRGIKPQHTRENLQQIIVQLKQQGSTVVLAGMKAPLTRGIKYASTFNGLYEELADENDLVFQPFFLDGIARNTSLNQPDGIHPNTAGVSRMVENTLPYIEEAIEVRED